MTPNSSPIRHIQRKTFQHSFKQDACYCFHKQHKHTFVAIGIPSSVIKPPMLLALTVLLDRVRPSGATPRST